MSKCEHGLTSAKCFVCASPKYAAAAQQQSKSDELLRYLQDVLSEGTPTERVVARTCLSIYAAPQQQAETLQNPLDAMQRKPSDEYSVPVLAEHLTSQEVTRVKRAIFDKALREGGKEQQAEPVAYLCPAGCGCTWRDNKDGSMSLFGRNSRSCATCEHLPLSGLIPVHYPPLPTPRITAEQVEQIKRLAGEYAEAAGRAMDAEPGSIWYDIKGPEEERKARAALHAALDALVAKGE